MPEAQEQMLEEADELIGNLPLPAGQQLLTLLETLQHHTQEVWEHQINQILSNPSSSDIRTALELSMQNSNCCADALQIDSSALLEPVS